VADYFGVSRVMVTYHIALLTRLPSGFVEWLRACDDPFVLRHFTERRLRPVTRIKSPDEQLALLDKMRTEAEAAAAGGKTSSG
jgi:hypothetical protein